MQHRMERLAELIQVEPPTSLDALVRERMQRVSAAHLTRAEGTPVKNQPPLDAVLVPASPWARVESSRPAPAGERAVSLPAVSLPFAERCVYAVGLMAYGAHAVGAAARLLWRAVAG